MKHAFRRLARTAWVGFQYLGAYAVMPARTDEYRRLYRKDTGK